MPYLHHLSTGYDYRGVTQLKFKLALPLEEEDEENKASLAEMEVQL